MVAVPTFDRTNELRRCIASILALVPPPDATVSVLVVDNGSAVPARSLVPDGVTVIEEPARGLATVRNRALDFAQADGVDLLAFIDDDNTCEPEWLVELVDAHRRTDADVVTGPSRPHFGEHEVTPAMKSYFAIPQCEHLSPRPVAFTGNVAFSRSCFADEPRLRFDTAYNFSGGEDTEFSQRLHKAGKRIVWSATAVVNSHQPVERLRWRWVFARQVGYGEGWARMLLSASEANRFQITLDGLVMVSRSVILTVAALALRRSPLVTLRPGLFGAGAVLKAFGVETQARRYSQAGS